MRGVMLRGGARLAGLDGGRVRGETMVRKRIRALRVRGGRSRRPRPRPSRGSRAKTYDAAGVGAEHHVRVGHVETKEAHAKARRVGQARRLRHRAPRRRHRERAGIAGGVPGWRRRWRETPAPRAARGRLTDATGRAPVASNPANGRVDAAAVSRARDSARVRRSIAESRRDRRADVRRMRWSVGARRTGRRSFAEQRLGTSGRGTTGDGTALCFPSGRPRVNKQQADKTPSSRALRRERAPDDHERPTSSCRLTATSGSERGRRDRRTVSWAPARRGIGGRAASAVVGRRHRRSLSSFLLCSSTYFW